jgi:glycosyltransferase involved in cell wall biosynthesis
VVLLCLARLHKRKGIDVLLRALGGMSARPRLWIAGDGPERGALEALAHETGVDAQVQFLGMRSDAADLLAGCDVFVVPSRSEGLGVVALEAMAAARPVVASAVGGLAHAVVEGRTGLLVSPEDPDALARALARVIEDPALRESLGDAGPGRVAEGFLAEQMVEAYESLYFEVLTPAAVPRDAEA